MAIAIKKDVSDIIKTIAADISSLGSLLFYGIVIFFSILLNQFVLATQLFVALVLVMLIASVIRFFFPKDRPLKQSASSSVISKIDASSFPSIHGARIACLAFIFGMMCINGGFFAVALGIILVAILVCASRIVLGKHYVSDVVAGCVLGLVVALLVLQFVK